MLYRKVKSDTHSETTTTAESTKEGEQEIQQGLFFFLYIFNLGVDILSS